VSLKKFFVDGDVLDGHEPVAGLVLRNRVDQERGIAIVDAVEERGKIEGKGHG
jgi:hypothetical protein